MIVKRQRTEYSKRYYKKNRKKMLLYSKGWYKKNRGIKILDTILWRKNNPYSMNLISAKQRCSNPKNVGFRYYGARGIKCLLTLNQVRNLWFRDKAYLMEKPSIDRRDSDGNYELSNCRFMELSKNSQRGNSMKERDEKGRFICARQ